MRHRNGILLDKHATPDGNIYTHSTMLSPVTLRIFPSCYDCLSWSDDGELAVAAGEYVHILVCDPAMLYRIANSSETNKNTDATKCR